MKSLIVTGISLFVAVSFADEPASSTTVKRERYLGVVTEPVSEALAVQLKGVLAPGRGLVVKRVLPDSPAARAGVQPFDVLAAADAKPLTSSDQFKELVTAQPQGQAIKLEYIRGAKAAVVDVSPAERTISRLIHRHSGTDRAPDENVASRKKAGAEQDQLVDLPAYSVGVQTRDGRNFQVDVRLEADRSESAAQTFSGTTAEIAARLKPFPEPVQRSVLRQMTRISEDRKTLRTVQFRFQPQRQGNRQVLAVTLRKPDGDGSVKSFEMQQPMGDVSQPMPLDRVLAHPEFAAQLKELDPAVREKISATLKTAALPAATLRVEDSQ